MYEVKPFRAADVLEIEFQYPQANFYKVIGPENTRMYAKHPGFTGRFQGKIVGAGGIIQPWKGLGEAWAIATPLVRQHRKFFHSTVAKNLPVLAEVMGLRRLQAMVIEDFAPGHRWVEALGFQKESVMPWFGPNGENMVVYVRFFNEAASSLV